MAMTEAQLKESIAKGTNLFVLYGEETYLTDYYTKKIISATVEDGLDAFNYQAFDGQEASLSQIEEAVEALPMMAEKKCVQVRDMDFGTADTQQLLALMENLPDTCVLIFRQIVRQPDRKKGWTTVLKEAEKYGAVMRFDRKETGDCAKLLVAVAKKKGGTLSPEDARFMVEQGGNDLNLQLNELEKFIAVAPDGVITRELIDAVGTKNLETRVFDLSKAILGGKSETAFTLLHRLFEQKEEPVAVLGVLSNAYADLYRAKVAVAGGMTADQLAKDFPSYKGKEFRLRNATRDASRYSVQTLRSFLSILADTDRALKNNRGDGKILLEQAVSRLLERR